MNFLDLPFVNSYEIRCLRRVAADTAGKSLAVTYVSLKDKKLISKVDAVSGNLSTFKGWTLTDLGRKVLDHEGWPTGFKPSEAYWEKQRVEKELRWVAIASAATPIERRVATILCQHNRITRDMPSEAEIGRAMSMARSLIKEVQDDFSTNR